MRQPDIATRPAADSGAVAIGRRTIHRIGFGALRVTGPGFWGPPADPAECVRVLQHAVALGVNLIDTADSYGPHISEELIRRALHPYPDDLVIATKAGLVHMAPGAGEAEWQPLGRPDYLRMCCETSLRRLGLERIDLFYLHSIDPAVAREEQFGLLKSLLDEGKIGAVGLSNVSVADIEAAQAIVPVAAVQNLYNYAERQSQDVLEYCEAQSIAFVSWAPFAKGALTDGAPTLSRVAASCGASPAQVALAWLLAISPCMVAIPGTATLNHVEENCAAGSLSLTAEQMEALAAMPSP